MSMPEIKKRLILDKLDYYETHLSLINCLLPVKMTPTEIKVLAAFMSLEGDVAKYRFGTTGRKIVMNNLGLKSSGLSNYIKTMTEKGFLTEVADTFEIWAILHPQPDFQEYKFRLDNKNHNHVNVTSQANSNG
jgi:hypothetical protein